jgi:hypothetical protein
MLEFKPGVYSIILYFNATEKTDLKDMLGKKRDQKQPLKKELEDLVDHIGVTVAVTPSVGLLMEKYTHLNIKTPHIFLLPFPSSFPVPAPSPPPTPPHKHPPPHPPTPR